jgi:putative effector of murein hydrolase LrgA (UPF0299 family)
MSALAKTKDQRLVRFVLAFVAIAAGVYLGTFSVHTHHVPWPGVIITMVALAVVSYFLLRKKA